MEGCVRAMTGTEGQARKDEQERAFKQGERYQRTGKLVAFKLDPDVFDALERLGFL